MDLTHKCMFNVKPATKWDEAYPSGNGSQGVLVMGNPLDETIIFNHERLFLPLPINEASVLPDMSGELPVIRRLIKEGRYREATRHFLDRISEKGYPRELIWPDPFHPAYDLRIKTDDAGETADYLRWLDFETGEAGVRWHGSRGVYNRQVFVSRACNAVIIKLGAPSEGKLDCDICLEERPGKEHIKSVSVRAGRMADFTGQMPEQPYSGNDIWLVFDSRYEVGNGGFCGRA